MLTGRPATRSSSHSRNARARPGQQRVDQHDHASGSFVQHRADHLLPVARAARRRLRTPTPGAARSSVRGPARSRGSGRVDALQASRTCASPPGADDGRPTGPSPAAAPAQWLPGRCAPPIRAPVNRRSGRARWCPRRSGCRARRSRSRAPGSAPSTWPSPAPRPRARRWRCSRSSSRRARSRSPSSCP